MFILFQTDLEKRLVAVLEPMVVSHGCELVQLKAGTSHNKLKLVLFVDEISKTSSIKLEKLEFLNRLISDALDVADAQQKLFNSSYELEISSPGLDRPLAKKNHFDAALEKLIRLKTDGKEKPKVISGKLMKVNDEGILVKAAHQNENISIVWNEVRDAHLIYEFPKKGSLKRRV